MAAKRKRIHLVRHGEGLHNVTGDYSLKDPALTPLGERQARALSETATRASAPHLVVASPFRRTLQTATLGWPDHAARPGAIVSLGELQEAGTNGCDFGTPGLPERDFPHVDHAALAPDWHEKRGKLAPSEYAELERARWVRHWLRDRPERDIAVVSHGGFLLYLSGQDPYQPGWRNTECRTYTFASDDDWEAALVLLGDEDPPIDDADGDAPPPAERRAPADAQAAAGVE